MEEHLRLEKAKKVAEEIRIIEFKELEEIRKLKFEEDARTKEAKKAVKDLELEEL